jgi:hypothetical protein
VPKGVLEGGGGMMKLHKGQIVDGYRDVLTQGSYMGEEGVGYAFGTLPRHGDYSGATHGRLQGYTEPVKIEILRDDAFLADMSEEGYGVVMILPRGTQHFIPDDGWLLVDGPITAAEAILYGFARIVREEGEE